MNALDLLKDMTPLFELRKEMKAGVTDMTVNDECSNCGACCARFLPVSAKDIKAIHRYLKKHPINEQVHNYPTSKPMIDFRCPFRSDDENKCLIYEVRPAICRDFRCDKPRKGITASRDMYHDKYGVCDMRGEFFGRELL